LPPRGAGESRHRRFAGGIERDDAYRARQRVRRLHAEARFGRRIHARGFAHHGHGHARLQFQGYTEAGATAGRAINASRAPSVNGTSGGRTIAADRTFWCSGSTPGGTTAVSVSAFTARSSRVRAMMMPLSVDTRVSVVRATMVPMLLWSDAFCIDRPSKALN